MRTGNRFSKSGVVLLAMLMLSLSSGIHSRESHFLFHRPAQFLQQDSSYSTPEEHGTAHDHCAICHFNQLLQQCLFPAMPELAPAESFRRCARALRTPVAFLNPTPEVTRGPPPATHDICQF